MAAASLLKSNPHPTDRDIDEAMTNICRCGTYQRIRAAVHMAADLNTKGGKKVAADELLNHTAGMTFVDAGKV
jgi:xanthine dehydrogenase iron-sulfur cluster and FAD-binding subunit A